ncbi:PREDICTED: ubiquitin domain-containing protein DSK2b-like isoform X3 [Ipomoea nil]|uniref:ubiquitin domain-containing protein DSK2b-like isoform X3 n=1 Tax=Ipomoea nil TaxID=35883 RepID=UPI00090192EF|nr:PREDICTED: ubiquitin domain-containing protein DSK2b-like isoform X3 [Ipomoea nil]
MGGGDASVAGNRDGGDSDSENNAEAGGCSGNQVAVFIRSSNGSKFSVEAYLGITIGAFKSLVAQQCDIPAEQQRLIYKGRILKDDQTLESYGLAASHTIHLVRGFASAASTNTAGAGNPGAPSPNQNALRDTGPDVNVGGTFDGSGLGASLFPGLNLNRPGSGAGLFGDGLPDFDRFQQHMSQNPDMMRDILNMPLFQNLMNNPEIIRNSILNNPQMRDIMDRNPELAHVLNDPATLRQTMEAARNPELMRELMRNTDRAMSNIESSPEGFNMLRRMYETVQEPLLNATTMSGDMRSDMGSNPFAALLGSQGVGQGRDQLNNPPTTGSETTPTSPAPNTNPLPNPWASAGTGGTQTNTTARSNPAGDARAAPQGRLGGRGLPDLLSGMPDANTVNQLMQNPAISQMMQSVLSNPQYMNQILGLNPQLRSMLDSNPQLREMMQNPDLLRQLTSPETMRQLMNFQQSLSSQLGRQQTNRELGQNGGAAGIFVYLKVKILFYFPSLNMKGAHNTLVKYTSNLPDSQRFFFGFAKFIYWRILMTYNLFHI